MKRILMIAALTGLPYTAMAEITEQYDSLNELIHEHGDYEEGNGTFELYSEEPLSFRLSKISTQWEPEQVTYYENWRAAIYGIYNTFSHTGVDELAVEAVPLSIPGFNRWGEAELIGDRSVAIFLSRYQALKSIRKVVDVAGYHDIKVSSDYRYQWGENFFNSML